MKTHDTKPEAGIHRTPIVTDTAREEAAVISSSLMVDAELAIADDNDSGCDPYNSTGQHVVMRPKRRLNE